MNNNEEIVGYTSFTLQILIVAVLVVSTILTLKKIDFTIERWAAILIVMYILSAAVSAVSWIIYYSTGHEYSIQHRDPIDCIQDSAQIVILVMLYTFVFELSDLKIKL